VRLNRAVLLAAAADGEDFAERDLVLFHLRKSRSSAAPQSNGELCLMSGSRWGSTPFLFLNCGSAWSKFKDFFVMNLAGVEVNDPALQALRAGIESKK